jgi:hypothetical protein
MLKHKLFLSSCLLISISGLVSCSPDKPKAVDDWSVAAPIVRDYVASSDGRLNAQKMELQQAFFTKLSMRASVIFPSLATEQDTVQIDAHTDCQRDGERESLDWNFNKQSEIPLISLLPEAFISSPSKPLEIFSCNIRFVVTNSHGSTHEMTLPNLQIQTLPQDANLVMRLGFKEFKADRYDDNVVSESEFADLVINKAADKAGVAVLACDKFIARKAFARDDLISLLDLAKRVPVRARSQNLADPRQQFAWQRCQLQLLTDGQSRTVSKSPYFTLKYAPPVIQVSSEMIREVRAPSDGRVLKMDIENPYSFPISIMTPPTVFSVKLIDYANSCGAPVRVCITTKVVSGGESTGITCGNMRATIFPHQTAHIVGSVSYEASGGGFKVPGIFYSFENSLTVSQAPTFIPLTDGFISVAERPTVAVAGEPYRYLPWANNIYGDSANVSGALKGCN